MSSFIRGKNTPPKYYLHGPLAGSLTAGYTIARCENRAWKRRAKACGKFVPACARIARKKMFLTAGEKSAIVKYEKALRYADHLFPLRGQAAKDLRDKWFEASPNIADGTRRYKRPICIPAIQLRGIGTDAKLTVL